ncbi:MAG: hypothetical protein P8106_10530 [Gammaproteobacteria bacterium]
MWRILCERARLEGLSPDAWLGRQLGAGGGEDVGGALESPRGGTVAWPELVLNHFAGLDLDRREARMIAAGIYGAVQRGERHRVGPIGNTGRHYVFERHGGEVGIGVADGQIRLPLAAALRLAGDLADAERKMRHAADVAA